MDTQHPTDIVKERERLMDVSHYEHEDIIRLLQDHPDPESIPYLQRAILLKPKLKYLDYDDYGTYYKKCLWALQEIGTTEAINVIRECANSNIPALQEQALYRLRRITSGDFQR